MAVKRPAELPVLDDSDRDMLAVYGRARGRLRAGLVILLCCIVVAIIFREPKKWGDRDIAQIVNGLAWFGVVVGWIIAHIANGHYSEARGYFRGRFGNELSQRLLRGERDDRSR